MVRSYSWWLSLVEVGVREVCTACRSQCLNSWWSQFFGACPFRGVNSLPQGGFEWREESPPGQLSRVYLWGCNDSPQTLEGTRNLTGRMTATFWQQWKHREKICCHVVAFAKTYRRRHISCAAHAKLLCAAGARANISRTVANYAMVHCTRR